MINKLLALLPPDGSPVANGKLLEQLSLKLGKKLSQAEFDRVRDGLVEQGLAAKGKGRGGSLRRITESAGDLVLEAPAPKPAKPPKAPTSEKPGRGSKPATGNTTNILAYHHDEKRCNNPEVGMVTTESDHEERKATWAYDPHIDPALQFDVKRSQVEKLIDDALSTADLAQMRSALEALRKMSEPYLNWAGKAERTSFEVDTVSLHVHERIDPATLLRAIRKRMTKKGEELITQADLFQAWFEAPLPYREAIDFYKHDRGWANRLIAGDSLLVMNSLLQKEGMAGQVQMIYIDPPYGIKYGSNFQPFVGRREVKDGSDNDLTQEPEMIKAFRDTWELGIHSYLTYLRDRLLLSRELLTPSGSVFVQISDENLHLVRNLLDEVFGPSNFCGVIPFLTTTSQSASNLGSVADYLVWYGKDVSCLKYRQLYTDKDPAATGGWALNYARFDGYRLRPLTKEEREDRASLPPGTNLCRMDNLTSQGPSSTDSRMFFWGREFTPGSRNHWKTTREGMKTLARAGRILDSTSSISYIRLLDDFAVQPINNVWTDVTQAGFVDEKAYVVQTVTKVVERCLLMTTDPGDLVLDPTCGSGTTGIVAEKWGRRWVTCDTSRVAITLAKQRLLTAGYDYFDLRYPHEGLKGGFVYKTIPHVTLKDIAQSIEINEIWERLHPHIARELAELNSALRNSKAPAFEVSVGARKGQVVVFDSPSDQMTVLPSGEEASQRALLEWEVPYVLVQQWNGSVRAHFDAFHNARKSLQRQIDKSIGDHAAQVVLYDQPTVAVDKLRVTGPFTVEAVPFPSVLMLDEVREPDESDASVARYGESARQHTWRDELLKTGVRGKNGQILKFAQLETIPGTRYLHCTGTLAESGDRAVVSFGPEYAALEQRQVELAKNEASELFPTPKMLIFCAFTFDPEAAKDIDAIKGVTALKVQMNTDLLTEDLKKAKASNQSFWLMGQPDVQPRQRMDGKWEVEVNGFDYFDTVKGELVSGGKGKIAMWLLDTDYDERSLFPRQVFFPMAGTKDGWNRLKKDIRMELNESFLERLHGTVSIPFEAGENRKVAVKIIDDRGIESLKVIPLA